LKVFLGGRPGEHGLGGLLGGQLSGTSEDLLCATSEWGPGSGRAEKILASSLAAVPSDNEASIPSFDVFRLNELMPFIVTGQRGKVKRRESEKENKPE
jgi:hypothetical protein